MPASQIVEVIKGTGRRGEAPCEKEPGGPRPSSLTPLSGLSRAFMEGRGMLARQGPLGPEAPTPEAKRHRLRVQEGGDGGFTEQRQVKARDKKSDANGLQRIFAATA